MEYQGRVNRDRELGREYPSLSRPSVAMSSSKFTSLHCQLYPGKGIYNDLNIRFEPRRTIARFSSSSSSSPSRLFSIASCRIPASTAVADSKVKGSR
ncbi:hypothetical protein D0Y65_010844 [Glycine soja]|uniref:Uncharacterized protein n=1 Tax=Glycine soja TaxID=3848 RepID=A0A445KH72_GLYSO|nr:hypothetical protein D0Y65_010844 [Glycine soja]